jgi:hypothetical protein
MYAGIVGALAFRGGLGLWDFVQVRLVEWELRERASREEPLKNIMNQKVATKCTDIGIQQSGWHQTSSLDMELVRHG